MSMTTISTHTFVTRQTRNSPYSHFTGTWAELEALVLANMDRAVQGYREGVLLVPVPAAGFFSAVVNVTPETPLQAQVFTRREGEGEAPYIQVTAAAGSKAPATVVNVVLYSKATLAEDNDVIETDYAIISINARVTPEEEPMHPTAMMRNFLGLAGGTKATYTAEEFARSIQYWSTRCSVSGVV